MTNVVAKQIAPENQQAIANILDAMFGTPDEPFAMPETGLNQRLLKMAAGPVWSDEAGGKHGLYRRHCVHCHGISGDGHGPTAAILNPYPRDYRPGVFKFKSTYHGRAADGRRLASRRARRHSGHGHAVVRVLPPDEQEALVEYVKYLSIRGKMETALEDYVGENLNPGDKFDPATNAELRNADCRATAEADRGVVAGCQGSGHGAGRRGRIPLDNRTPAQVAESVNEGRELFYGPKANCVKCHGPTGLGDGQQDDYDDWSKATLEFIKGTDANAEQIKSLKKDLSEAKGDDVQTIKEQISRPRKEYNERQEVLAGLLPPRHAIPRNLREGIYRGGRRPIDLFWRIAAGIRGTPMPGIGPRRAGRQGTLTSKRFGRSSITSSRCRSNRRASRKSGR